ncbi:hypothetical protein KP509_23G047600 [Ceratopteris richardii]|uniref:CRM domain-containing protein n=1 Tax=Ceratopteris richardii TaxID=49495 RepID=A0A8T2S2G9_CERRI|nr:hypothetical protein KP509_23G047600 [Ceratopteris richardii]
MALIGVPSSPGIRPEGKPLAGCSNSPYVMFVLHRACRVPDIGVCFATAADAQQTHKGDRSHSPKSASSSTKHIPPWRTSWTTTRRRFNTDAPTRDWSYQERNRSSRSRRREWPGHGEKSENEGDRPEGSPYISTQQCTAMGRIIEKLRDIEKTLTSSPASGNSKQDRPLQLQLNADTELIDPSPRYLAARTAGELFLPRPNQNIFSIGSYWSTPDHPIPAPGRGVLDAKLPWEFEEKNKEEEADKRKKNKAPSLAEILIPPKQLRKLRTAGITLGKQIKVGRLGITDNIADKIIGQWRSSELVKIKCVGPAATNMMRIHKDVERKTGGLVVWRAGGVVVVYRGNDYDAVNKVPISLDAKLDGLLASNQTLRKYSPNVNQVHALSEDSKKNGSLISHDVAGDQENVPQKDGEEHLSTTSFEGSLPTSDHWGCKQGSDAEIQVHSQPMPTEKLHEDDLQMSSGFKYTLQIPRPDIYPDPFVDRDYEIEINSILETLGPRCKDWTGATPVPVDADLLPPVLPNYRPPYRLLPYGVRSQLTSTEQTDLRRLVRHITPHFVLGRNKGHQGLAAAILKLWERSEVVKIAVKSGVQNSSSEKMANELKKWTGGVLISRDRYFITLYRGKDFLPRQLALALTERTTMLRNLKACDEFIEGGISTINNPIINDSSVHELRQKAEQERIEKVEARKDRKISMMKELEGKIALAVEKKRKAEADLERLETIFAPADEPADVEFLTEEERYMFRRLGLKMKPFLLIGRRGVFSGVVENIHLHWKYRELVKLIVKEKNPVKLQETAKMLERESGGILISIDSTSKGQAIIIYRGKNYCSPENLRPKNLLDKRKAMERSLELQRRASLTSQITALEQELVKLKASLNNSEKENDELLDAALEEFSNSSLDTKLKFVHEGKGHDSCETANQFPEDNVDQNLCTNKEELLKLVKLGPIFRATRLSNLERLKLRKLALKLGVGSRFSVGKKKQWSCWAL